MNLQEAVNGIQPLDEKAMEQAREHWDSIAHPLHSLGKLEDMVVQIAGITGDPRVHTEKRVLVPMCADNGVVEEGVTQTGQEITALVAESFLQTKAASSIMCKTVNCDIFPVDVGVATEVSILNRKIAYGTKNMAKEPAMTREQAIQAVETGIEVACMMKEKGYQIMATGEMGIGNTTTSSAIASVLLDLPVEKMTGRACHMPVVIDGVISATGAVLAAALCPQAKDYMLASHVSKEPAGELILKALGKEAPLHCDMCLGEGTGALNLFPLLDTGLAVYHGMSDFGNFGMEAYQHLE